MLQKTPVLYRKPLLSMQTPSEILELSPLALTGAPSQVSVIKIPHQKGKKTLITQHFNELGGSCQCFFAEKKPFQKGFSKLKFSL